MKIELSRLFAGVILFSLISPNLLARATAVTLAQLVSESPTILYGHADASAAKSQQVPFEVSLVLKGPASLGKGRVILCNSPPPMREYPDLSKLTGNQILFLSEKKGECFDLSHTYRSVVNVRDDIVSTVAIQDEPKRQSYETFLKKIRLFVSKQAHTARANHQVAADFGPR